MSNTRKGIETAEAEQAPKFGEGDFPPPMAQWAGTAWIKALLSRQLRAGPLAWVCVTESGSQKRFQFTTVEALEIQCVEHRVWPLHPVRPRVGSGKASQLGG